MTRNPLRTTRTARRALPVAAPLAALLSGTLAAAGAAPGTEVFVCRSPERTALYSQFPCAGTLAGADGGEVQEILRLDPLQTLRVPPLNEAERKRLAALSRRAEDRHERRLARRQSQMRDQSRDRQRRLERCSAARRQLEELAERRRKGYSVGEAEALASRERALDAEVAKNC